MKLQRFVFAAGSVLALTAGIAGCSKASDVADSATSVVKDAGHAAGDAASNAASDAANAAGNATDAAKDAAGAASSAANSALEDLGITGEAPVASTAIPLKDGSGSVTFDNSNPEETAINKEYAALDYQKGPLGEPTQAVTKLSDGAALVRFEHGVIYFSPKIGSAYASWGDIENSWGKSGFEKSEYGFPVGDEAKHQDGTITQEYEHATATWNPGNREVNWKKK